MSVRDLLLRFGHYKRGKYVREMIRAALRDHGLTTIPDIYALPLDYHLKFQALPPIVITPSPASVNVQAPEIGIQSSGKDDDVAARGTGEPQIGRGDEEDTLVGSLKSSRRGVVSVSPNATLQEAMTEMMINDYSQLPVMIGDRTVKGVVSWRTIGQQMARKGKLDTVADCSTSDFREVASNRSLMDIVEDVIKHDFVLVRDEVGCISGIVTSTDLSREFRLRFEPFQLLSEVEDYLRTLLETHLPRETIENAKDPDDKARTVSGVHDLSFGEYQRLLEHPENWNKLPFGIDRKTFLRKLDRIREVRNEVMHFSPDPPEESELEELRSFVRCLKTLCH
jgi:CBS domain-containing protein